MVLTLGHTIVLVYTTVALGHEDMRGRTLTIDIFIQAISPTRTVSFVNCSSLPNSQGICTRQTTVDSSTAARHT
eukprot:6188002-Pleurochrysis_carterae.AAC.2